MSSEQTYYVDPPNDVLLTFHSNHGPISYRFRFRYRRQFPSKMKKNPTTCFFAPPLTGLPLELGVWAGVIKNRNDGDTKRSKTF